MKNLLLIIALVASAPVAMAQEAPQSTAPAAQPAEVVTVRLGQTIYTADGLRLGTVDRVMTNGTVLVNSRNHLLRVPQATLSRQDGKVVTSMTNEQLLATR